MVPFGEDGFRIECLLPRKRGFSECMGAMLANHHDPYIQRGDSPFVIRKRLHSVLEKKNKTGGYERITSMAVHGMHTKSCLLSLGVKR